MPEAPDKEYTISIGHADSSRHTAQVFASTAMPNASQRTVAPASMTAPPLPLSSNAPTTPLAPKPPAAAATARGAVGILSCAMTGLYLVLLLGAVSMVVSQLMHVDSPFGLLAAFVPGAGAASSGAGGGGAAAGAGGAARPNDAVAATGTAGSALVAGGRAEAQEGNGAMLQGQGAAVEGLHNRAAIDMSHLMQDRAAQGMQQPREGVPEQQAAGQAGEERDGVEVGGLEKERHLQAAGGEAGGGLVAADAHWLTQQLTSAGAAAATGAGSALPGATGGGGALQQKHKRQKSAVAGLTPEQAETRAARAAASLGAMTHLTPTASSAGQKDSKVAEELQTHHHHHHEHHHHHQHHEQQHQQQQLHTGVGTTGHGTAGAGPHAGAQRRLGSRGHARRRQARDSGGAGWRWRRALVSKATWGTRIRGR